MVTLPEKMPIRRRGAELRALAMGMLAWATVTGTASSVVAAGSSHENTVSTEVSFRNDVLAVLSRAGCNAGTCHGNRNGKGGFKLSLRGEDPELDYANLTRDQFARRVDPLQPEQSLILLKPLGRLAHEGGRRFQDDSLEHRILRRWIAAGLPNDLTTAPQLLRLEVAPQQQVLVAPASEVQLQVRGYFSDGQVRDLRGLAVYESSRPLVKVSAEGMVRGTGDGEVTLLIRYLQKQEPVRLAFVPARPGFKWSNPPARNYIDEQVFAKLRSLRLNPSPLCSDEVFVRRAYLDLLGLLPTTLEARNFLADRRSDKRERLVDVLLERPEFADSWALKWADLLRVEAHSLDQKGVQGFHQWIRRSVAENRPVDQFVRELITARGSTYTSPAANYYRPHRDAISRAKAAAQVFLGLRLQCAECHNHPSDRWTQDDFYDWMGLFARVGYKVIENNREISSDEHEWNGEQVIYTLRQGEVKNPRTGQAVQPRFLGVKPAAMPQTTQRAGPGEGASMEALAQWLTKPDNPWFARVQANRIWHHLLGRGLVDPPDDFRATNPASHPELLDALAQDFIEHQFDLRHLLRRIIGSRTYQLSSEPNDTNGADEFNYSHALVRRLGAEQLLDCESQVTGVSLKFAGYPSGLRASQLPGVRPESKGRRRASAFDQFLETFGKPPRLLTTDTERSCECNMNQAFQMLGGPTLNELLAEKDNRLTALLARDQTDPELLAELFWTTLTRPPTQAELAALLPGLESAKNKRAELEDITWGLLNSKDFLFRR